jgi:hypothetical protein
MASRIVVGLFESAGIAKDALNRLESEGVPTSDIFLKILKETGPIPSTMEPELEAGFLGPVILVNFRESFADHIHNGETLISVQALTDERVALAVGTLKQYAPLKVEVLSGPEGALSSGCVGHALEKADDSRAASQAAGNSADSEKPTPTVPPKELTAPGSVATPGGETIGAKANGVKESAPPISAQDDQGTRGQNPPADGAKPVIFDSPVLVPSEEKPMQMNLNRHHPFVKPPTEMRDLVRDIYAVAGNMHSL